MYTFKVLSIIYRHSNVDHITFKIICKLLSCSLFCFQGIVKALQEYQKKLIEHKVEIYVRRGGPNYQEGLRVMREVGKYKTANIFPREEDGVHSCEFPCILYDLAHSAVQPLVSA